jgi:hypothetical protein
MSPVWVRWNFGFIVTAAVSAVFMTCMLAPPVFAQTDSLGELLVGKAVVIGALMLPSFDVRSPSYRRRMPPAQRQILPE